MDAIAPTIEAIVAAAESRGDFMLEYHEHKTSILYSVAIPGAGVSRDEWLDLEGDLAIYVSRLVVTDEKAAADIVCEDYPLVDEYRTQLSLTQAAAFLRFWIAQADALKVVDKESRRHQGGPRG